MDDQLLIGTRAGCAGVQASAAAGTAARAEAKSEANGRMAGLSGRAELRPVKSLRKLEAVAERSVHSHVRDQDGAALIIDYGHVRSDAGDTLQAVAQHSYANPLRSPGLFDITAFGGWRSFLASRPGGR